MIRKLTPANSTDRGEARSRVGELTKSGDNGGKLSLSHSLYPLLTPQRVPSPPRVPYTAQYPPPRVPYTAQYPPPRVPYTAQYPPPRVPYTAQYPPPRVPYTAQYPPPRVPYTAQYQDPT
ncbi:hypothetical protein Hamer_G022611 [Homarus americanus]|uniref:Uncharacterized protein n=1 Tax=Homarus americanus TaxID=6706 RepID=A0A8J5ML62_HOMAM|nr:hypothetical protein Hamer_G022611 [Homarus americanus]